MNSLDSIIQRHRNNTNTNTDINNKTSNDDTITKPSSQQPPTKTATPKNYAQTIVKHAQTTHNNTLFPGQNYKRLAEFLSRPYGSLLTTTISNSLSLQRAATNLSETTTASSSIGPRYGQIIEEVDDDISIASSFITLYHYSPSQPTRVSHYGPGKPDLDSFERLRPPLSADTAQLLFMRGFIPPEWINSIGSTFRVDPEYIRRHLSFLLSSSSCEDMHFDLPGLPCTSRNFIKLPLVTNAIRGGKKGMVGGVELGASRSDADIRTSMYLGSLLKGGEGGKSIVRKLLVHNEEYFSIEQEISITIQMKSGGWIAIIWLDCGEDALESHLGDWLRSSRTSYLQQYGLLPVFQFSEKMAMKRETTLVGSRQHSDSTVPTTFTFTPPVLTQSATLLHRKYGQNLDPNVMKVDAFYAVSELFTFTAFSENQFLNLISAVIESERNVPMEKMQASLANLQASGTMLEAHAHAQEAVIQSIKARGGPRWPRAADPRHIAIADAMAQGLLEDYNHLLARSKSLRAQCTDLTTLLMNKAMLAEAQRGIIQAEGLARLTLLAFFFVPLSFTTSFFGMNFEQFFNSQGPSLSIYIWFVVSVPVFAASLGFLFWTRIVTLVGGVVRYAFG